MASMTSKRDYYEVLGVVREASTKEVATAYRRLAIKFHPDSNRDDEDATERFKEATEAYEVLSDAEKRARYDRYGHAGVEGSVHQYDRAEDIFEAFFSGGIFGDLFGSRRGGGRRQRRGADVRCEVTLELEEAVAGAKKTVRFRRNKICETCRGSGAAPGSSKQTCSRCQGHGQVVQSHGILRVQTTCPTCRGLGTVITNPCSDCRGEGYVQERVTHEVDIPGGVGDGDRVRIPGIGQPSLDGGPPGDCYCFVTVKPHKIFQREGNHLLLQLPISYAQAALGAELEVPTLGEPATIKIAPGTQMPHHVRVRGAGVPDPHGGPVVGDLIVTTYIEVPKKLSKEQRRLLMELAELDHEHVTPHRKSFLEKMLHWGKKNDD